MSGSPLPLHEKFEKLLKATTTYFAEPQGNLEQDRASIERLREFALLVASESRQPRTFGRFVAYLLGTPSIQAQYPLHAIQFMSLAALLLRNDQMKERDFDEVLTAAYLADFGFRAAWLSFQNAHSGASVFHLRGLGLPWWSLWIERMILYHHDPASDASPHRVFSVISQYLALTQRTGVDDAGQDVLTPARAVEAIMENPDLDADAKRYFLNALSVFPLGSWVRLNDGRKGLVIGHPSGQPLRPTLGIYHAGEAFGLRHGDASVELIDLTELPNAVILSETQPSAELNELFAHPELWIASWRQAADQDDALPALSADIAEPPSPQGWIPPPGVGSTPGSAMNRAAVTNFIPSTSPTTAPIGIVPAAKPPVVLQQPPTSIEPPAPVQPAHPPTLALTPEELVGAASTLAADIARTLEHLEVDLHHIRHKGQTVFSDLPEELKKIRDSFGEIRAFMHTLSSETDDDVKMLLGALHIWEGDISETESHLHALRAFSTLFLDAWEEKKKDAQRLLQSLHGPELAARWRDLETAWNDRVKPALEEMARTLTHQWNQRQHHLQKSESELHRQLETAERTRALLVEKMALVELSRGLKFRKERAWDNAIAAFQKALLLNPTLWEAHTYLGLCHMDAASDSHFKKLRQPPAA